MFRKHSQSGLNRHSETAQRQCRKGNAKPTQQPKLFRPVLEALEDRTLLAATLDLIGNQTLVANTNVNVSNNAVNMTNTNESEMVVDINPTNPLNVVGFVHDTSNLNQIQVFFSTDGGSNWVRRLITDVGNDKLTGTNDDGLGSGARFDPAIKFDASGRLYVAYGMDSSTPTTRGTTTLVVAASADGGNTFTQFVQVDQVNNLFSFPFIQPPSVGLDKWQIATGPSGPNTTTPAVYVAYWDIRNNRNVVAGSRNGGANFTAPVTFADTNHVGSDAFPGVGPNGQLYVTWSSGSHIFVDRDLDGLWSSNNTFGRDVNVRTLNQVYDLTQVPAQPRRGVANGPVLDVDRSGGSHNGRLYVAFLDGFGFPFPPSSTDIYLVWSDDQGAHWTKESGSGNVEGSAAGFGSTDFLPWVAVDQDTGSVNVAYYTTDGAPDNTQVNLRLASSTNGGTTFRKTNVTTQRSQASSMSDPNEFLEYIGLAVHDGTAQAFWADNRGAKQGLFTKDTESYSASVATVSKGNILRITGDDGGVARNDVITLRSHPLNSKFAEVIVNGQTQWAGLWASLGQVFIYGLDGRDTVNIEDLVSGVSLDVIGGDGDDTIILSSVAHDLSTINGKVTLNPGSQRDTLVINDDKYGFKADYDIAPNSFQRLGVFATGLIRYSGFLNGVVINGGNLGNSYNVSGSASGPMILNTGIGRDVVNVRATNGALRVNGQSGADTVNIGDKGSVQGIGGTLTITNDLGNSDVIVDDSANRDPRTGIILYHETVSGDFTAISGLTPGGIKLGRFDVSSLTISAGKGNNSFRIHDTLPAFYGRFQHTRTTVKTGAGSDTVTVDGTTGALALDVQGALQGVNRVTVGSPTGGINGISGRIDITGGAGVVNSLSINDAASTVRRDYVIGANFVQRLDKARIGYEHLSELTLQAGAQKDNIVVQDTMQVGPGRSTTIALSGGNDAIDVSRTTGTLSIYPGVSSVISVGNAASSLDNIQGAIVVTPPGAGNSVKLILDDRAATTTQQLDVAPNFFGTSFRRSGAADISVLFNPLASFQWFGGSGSDTFHVNALATTTTALLNGGGGSNLLTGPNLPNRWQITGANSGMLNNNITFSSMQSLSGGANADAFLFGSGGSVDGTINGLGGVNTLDYSAYTASTALSALVAWYKGEGNADDAVSGNNGVPVGDVQYAPGMVGQAFSFNGVDSYVRVPNSPALESANISVEAWVNATNPPAFAHILDKGDNSNLLPSYSLENENGGLVFTVSNGTTYTDSENDTAIWDGNWHHVVGTYDGASVRLYVDGAEVGSGSPSNIAIRYGLSNTNDLFIGSYDGEPRFDFPGLIDEPSVYNRALTPAEIRSLFDAGSAGKTAVESNGVTVNLQLSTATAIRDGISNIQNVTGSAGNDILVGNGGNVLNGGPGRDLLIAGAFASILNGGGDEDILIGGSTDYDTAPAALNAIMAEWARTDIGYETRVANLQSGANGVPALNANTVHSNGQANQLRGGTEPTERDLFFARLASELLDRDLLSEEWIEIV